MRFSGKLVPACLLLLLFGLLLLPRNAQAQEPDFTDTTDILNGQRYMLRADDLALVYMDAPQQAPHTNVLFQNDFLTENSQITQAQFFTTTSQTSLAIADPTALVAMGRMFDQPTDVIAVVAQEASASDPSRISVYLTVFDRSGNRSQRILLGTATPAGGADATPVSVLMADFTGDGFDDFVLTLSNSNPYTVIVTAVNPEDWSAGLTSGPPFIYSIGPVPPFADMAAADVDGNGQFEIVATVANMLAPADGPQLVVLGVDPATLTITQQAVTNVAVGQQSVQVVSGNWDDNPADDEVIFVASGSGAQGSTSVQLYDFAVSTPTAQLLDQVQAPGTPSQGVLAVSGRVDWLDGDAVAVAAQANDSYQLTIFTAEYGRLQQQATFADSANGSLQDMTLGRFDNRTASGSTDPNLQAAAVLQKPDGNSFIYQVLIYDLVRSGNYAIAANSVYSFSTAFAAPPSLAAGDLQGRSLLLGAPAKITISGYSAPSTVVGLPPMHVDWVVPSCADPNYRNNCTTPQVVNILAQPAANYAQFNTQVKNSTQSSSQQTTSYSLATEATLDAKISFGIPKLASASVEVAGGVQRIFNSSVATATTSYGSVEFDASVRTGFADHVWYNNYRFNIWTYPIIGKTACPLTEPNCSPQQELQLHAQFSGPDQVNSYDADGNTLEWYQPLWEPGNLLSYPWTEAQLTALLPRTYISNRSNVWAADSSGSNASVTWEQGSGQNVDQATSLANSENASINVSAGVSIDGTGVSASVGISQTSTDSTQTLNSSSNAHGSSSGFAVNKTAQGVVDYVYAARTYILGQGSMTGTLQTLPLTSTVIITGPLRLAFWANPFDPAVGGAWWETAYVLPDVALNHPQRWTWANSSTDPNPMVFNQPVTSTSPYDQEFYMMRGLLVTPAGAPNGTQVTTAAISDTVLLQARVYNYSHLDMNDPILAQPAAKVKVLFYGQLFRSDSGAYPLGDSFLIGERELSPIPGYASTTTPGNVPNWSLAIQEFSPINYLKTQNGNVYVRFWVVVWMEDAAGNLVQEMAGHGLETKPMTVTINTMGDVAIMPYSNNVGTFKQVFYVQDPNAQAGGLKDRSVGAGTALTLTLSTLLAVPPVQPPTASGALGKHQISVSLRNGEKAGPIILVYHDGDPANGGRLFEWEMLPYVAAGAQFVNRVTYTPRACGDQTIYVTAKSGSEQVTASTTIESVPCVMILPIIGNE